MERRTFAKSILPGIAGAALWKLPEKPESRKVDLARLRLCAEFVGAAFVSPYRPSWLYSELPPVAPRLLPLPAVTSRKG